jgi:hypothetical protein
MDFWKDYLRQVFRAFWHALERTDTLVIGVFILAGIMAAGFGFFGGHAEHPSWQIALAIFLISLFVLLVRVPYRLYAEQRTTINGLNNKIARIAEDRPLAFTGLALRRCVQPRPPYGEWIIERIELGFENTGAERISWRLTEFSSNTAAREGTSRCPSVREGTASLHERLWTMALTCLGHRSR